jgi:chromate transporter
MKKNLKLYIKLFTSTFYLSAFTFGGGYVIVPLMRKKFVDQYHWIDDTEMIDLISIAQSSPGAIAVNTAIIIGFRLAGVFGSILTIIGTVLPPLITISIISLAYTEFRDSIVIGYVLRGMQAGVAAVIVDVVITMVGEIGKEKKRYPYFIMLGAFIAAFVFDINVIFIILVSAAIGALTMLYEKKQERQGGMK